MGKAPHWPESIGIQSNLLWVQIPSRLTSGSTICQCFLMAQTWKHIATLEPFPLATFIHIHSRKCIFPFGIILWDGSCSFGNAEASPLLSQNEEHCLVFVLKTAGCHVQSPALPPSSPFCGCYALIFPIYPGDCKCNKAMRSRAESKIRHSMIPQAVSPVHILQVKTASLYCQQATFPPLLQVQRKLIDTWWLEPSEFSLL